MMGMHKSDSNEVAKEAEERLSDNELDAISGGYSDSSSAPHENYDRFFEWAMNLPPAEGKRKGKATK